MKLTGRAKQDHGFAAKLDVELPIPQPEPSQAPEKAATPGAVKKIVPVFPGILVFCQE